MKIGIIGLGSIGRRHATCLLEREGISLIALRSGKGTRSPADQLLTNVSCFDNATEFYAQDPEGIIVANPTACHIESMLPALEQGLPVFVEKPVSDSLHQLKKLEPYADRIIVGYCFRFHSIYSLLKEAIRENKIGRIYKLHFRRSYYLPKWHPYADYRQEYTARKDLGGGVIRTLCHEIDILKYLFPYERVTSVTGAVDQVSDLEMDADDMAFFSCKLSGGARATFDLDLFSPDAVNQGTLFGTQGMLEFDLCSSTMGANLHTGQKPTLYAGGAEDIDEMYERQTDDLLTFFEAGKSRTTTLEEAAGVLRVIQAVESCTEVKVNDEQ